MKQVRGFTLLEVMVALAIFALVAASALTASARSLQTAARLEDKTLALWIADNRLIELQLQRQPPAEGRQQGKLEYAGRRWQWQSQVEATTDPALRRVTLRILAGDAPADFDQRALVSLSGFIETRP